MFLLVLGCRPQPAAPRAADPAQVQRGRLLFQHGESARGEPLVGLLGPERIELSGRGAACAGCHTPSGRGSREGGVEAPDVRPDALGRLQRRARGAVEDRSRPAYTPATLLRAITEGLSASGRPLALAMPRYRLGPAEREELLAYLAQLGEAADPGLTSGSVVLGAALPLQGPLAEAGQEAAAVLRAAIAEVNASGGVFRRTLELRVEDDSALYEGTGSGPDATSRLVAQGVFALLGSMRPGPLASDAVLAREGVPLVLPLSTAQAQEGGELPIFFLYPEESEQARLLVQHLAQQDEEHLLRRRPLLVVHGDDDAGRRWARAVQEEAEARALAAPVERVHPEGAREAGARGGQHALPPAAVLFQGSASGQAGLVAALEGLPAELPVYVPAGLAAAVPAPQREGRRVHVVYPPGLAGQAERLQRFDAFLQRHGLRPGHLAFQLGAYAAVQVMVEGLRRAGADLTRADLVAALEALRDFDTGVTRPVTFGVNRRVGVRGAQLVSLEPGTDRMVPASDWVPLSP